MPMFGFDERSVIFDVTPVANRFIEDYLPTAPDAAVKVYLYGLRLCYYPHENMSVSQIAHDLGLEQKEVVRSFRYWERQGLVHRQSDNPPSFRYINVTERSLRSDQLIVDIDPAYEAFSLSVQALFSKKTLMSKHGLGGDISKYYEWVEELALPPEVVILLLQHMINTRTQDFTFKSAQKLAVSLAQENARTIEDAEQVLSRDKLVWNGCRAVLRRMGKRRNPSVDEMDLYCKWTKEWGYSPEAVLAACARTTRGDPSFAYLDGILHGMKEKNGAASSATQMEQSIERDQQRIQPVKKLLATLGARDLTINESVLKLYDGFRTIYDDNEIILMAARECAFRGGRLDDVQALLESWQMRGLRTAADIENHIGRVKLQDSLLRKLYDEWGVRFRSSKADRSLLENWLGVLGFTEEMLIFCAQYASGTDKPMAYLDKVLKDFAEQGIRTPEQAAATRASHKNETGSVNRMSGQGKVISERQYEQRSYEATEDLPEWMQAMLGKMEADNSNE